MTHDLVLVGGGLANTLIALRLRECRPELSCLVLEQGPALGGNHTWSFHGTDVADAQLEWLRPLIDHSWSHYDIRFPDVERRLSGGYHTIFSERLAAVAAERLGDSVICHASVATVAPHAVELADGRRFEAGAVIDGRGDPGNRALDVRFQKFFGQVVELDAPSGIDMPILMDALVPQEDGYRFLYTLPLDARTLLIEDTRYSDGPQVEPAALRAEIARYAGSLGLVIRRVLREEQGALPVVLGGSLRAFWAANPGVPRSGIRAGLFHYVTGYSLPEAVRLADAVAAMPRLESASLYRFVRQRSFALWRRGIYYRLLNRMLFLAGASADRYRILQHFYKLPEDVIQRFYAGSTTWSDRLRIVTGKPPVPVGRAVSSMLLPQWLARRSYPAAGGRG